MVVLSALLASVALVQPVGPASALLIASAPLYLIGVSFAFNIAMNHRLEALRDQAEQAADSWRTYVPRWSFWNNVRTVASTAAAACFLLAGLLLASSG
ncbi:MAG: hypothetical protein CMM46_10545 [Rhodospirillaceae bacterium]|nr:hypothetical protein [Rhodospirillaceae bacterium]